MVLLSDTLDSSSTHIVVSVVLFVRLGSTATVTLVPPHIMITLLSSNLPRRHLLYLLEGTTQFITRLLGLSVKLIVVRISLLVF